LRAHPGKKVLQTRVHRILDGHAIAGSEQYSPDQIERLLAPIRNDQVIGVVSKAMTPRMFQQVRA
jgi:hypothetical protein